MEYFEIKIDTRLHNAMQVQEHIVRGVELVDYIQMKDIYKTSHMFSKKVKDTFEMYDSTLEFIPYELLKSDRAYWITACGKKFVIPEEENISQEYIKEYLKAEDKQPILQFERKNYSFFLVNLSVAESLLRRLPLGMRICKVRM